MLLFLLTIICMLARKWIYLDVWCKRLGFCRGFDKTSPYLFDTTVTTWYQHVPGIIPGLYPVLGIWYCTRKCTRSYRGLQHLSYLCWSGQECKKAYTHHILLFYYLNYPTSSCINWSLPRTFRKRTKNYTETVCSSICPCLKYRLN